MASTNISSGSVPIITIHGRYFFRGNERFIARGIVYQSHHHQGLRAVYGQWSRRDPLDDEEFAQLRIDVELLAELHINLLWIYNHDPDKSHQLSMDFLASRGIYVIFGADLMLATINRRAPMESYNEHLLTRYSAVVDSVSQYCNTLGVCVGNQIVNELSVSTHNNLEECQRVQSLVIRDLKTYMRYRQHDTGQRILPLCVSDTYWSLKNTSTFEYLTDPNSATRPVGGRVDFYCFTHYSVQPKSSLVSNFEPARATTSDESLPPWSPIKVKPPSTAPDIWTEQIPVQKFIDAKDPVPVMLSEYGCVSVAPRTFDETRQLYGTRMNSPLLNTLSGGCAYEFRDGSNHLGMINQYITSRLIRLSDFYIFGAQMDAALGLPLRSVPNFPPT